MIQRRSSRLSIVWKSAAIVCAVFLVFIVVWMRSGVVSLEYQLSSLEHKKNELMKEGKVLGAERASLLAVKRFETVASADGHLVFPDRTKVVFVKNGRQGTTYSASFVPGPKGSRIARD